MFQRQGREAQDIGDFKKALFYYIRAAAFRPDDAVLQNDLGLMFEHTGRLEEAESAYYEAIQIDHRYLPAYSNIAELYMKRGQYELAAMYFRRRVQLGGVDDPWMLKAQEQLEEVYRAAPELKNSRTLEEAARLEDQIAREREVFRQQSKRRKAMGYDVAFYRGLQEFKRAEYEQAAASFEEALTHKPGDRDAKHAYQRVKTRLRQLEVENTLADSLKENRDLIINKYVAEQQYRAESGQQ